MKKLLRLALIGLAAVTVMKVMAEKKAFEGLSEAEARERLAQKMPAKMPDDKRAEVTDKVIDKMRERGVLAGEASVGG